MCRIIFLPLFLGLFVITSLEVFATHDLKEVYINQFEKGESPLSILNNATSKTTYVLTQKNIYTLSNKRLAKYYTSKDNIYCVFTNDSSIWIGTDNGIHVIQLKDKTSIKIAVDPSAKFYKVISIFKKGRDSLFIATDAYGLYKWEKLSGAKKINTIFPINKGVSTSDSSIWIGSDAGLFRNKKGEWIRYNEEGVANFEIPDNIVQNLIVDDFGYLWVLMRDGVSVIDVKDHTKESASHHNEVHTHLPSVAFIGDHQNCISDLTYIKKKGYVFATEMGLLWMPVKSDEELLENFHHGEGEKIENKELLIKLNTSLINQEIGKVLFIVKNKNTVYLIGEKGVHALKGKELNKLLVRK